MTMTYSNYNCDSDCVDHWEWFVSVIVILAVTGSDCVCYWEWLRPWLWLWQWLILTVTDSDSDWFWQWLRVTASVTVILTVTESDCVRHWEWSRLWLWFCQWLWLWLWQWETVIASVNECDCEYLLSSPSFCFMRFSDGDLGRSSKELLTDINSKVIIYQLYIMLCQLQYF